MNRFLLNTAPGISELKPYVPGKPLSELERELGISESIKLASNENPLGASPRVAEAIEAALPDLARYPDGGGFELRQALARKHDVDADCITLGNGSNDVLDMVARVFLQPGAESLFSQYAFAVYPISSQAVGARLVIAPANGFSHDLEAMRECITPDTPGGVDRQPQQPDRYLAGAGRAIRLSQRPPARGHNGAGRGLYRICG